MAGAKDKEEKKNVPFPLKNNLSRSFFFRQRTMKSYIIIRFTNTVSTESEIRDLEIPLLINFDKDDVNRVVSATWLKLIIRNRVPSCERRRLRLIYNGRVLNQSTDFKKEIFEPKLRQLENQEQEESNNDNSPPQLRLYIHCVIGDELNSEQLNQENQLDQPQQVTTTPQVIGFDRLLQQGFSREDVDDLRRQFHLVFLPSFFESRNEGLEAINDVEEEERRQRLVSQLEERWIESTINNNAPPEAEPTNDTNTGTVSANEHLAPPAADLDDNNGNEDLLLGLSLGILLGITGLIFLIIDDSIFNKRQKMSVVGGLVINCSFAIIRGQWI